MRGKEEQLRDLIGTYFYTYPFFVTAIFMLLHMTGNPVEIWRVHTMIWIPAYLWLIRQNAAKLKWQGLFFMLHTLIFLMLIVYINADMVESYFVIIPLLLFLFFFSLWIKSTNYMLRSSLGVVAICCVVFTYMYLKSPVLEMRTYLIVVSLIMMTFYIFEQHLTNVNSVLESSADMLRQSVHMTRQRNQWMLLGFVAVVFFLISLFLMLGMDSVLGVVMSWIFGGIMKVFRWMFPLPEGSPVAEQDEAAVNSFRGSGPWWKEFITGQQSGLMLFLDDVFTVVFTILLIVAVLYGLYRFFVNRMQETTSHEVEFVEEKSLFIEDFRVKELKSVEWGESAVQKVRQIYRRTVRMQIKEGVPVRQSDTTQEICDKVDGESFRRMTQIFEKARYSEETVTDDDVQRMKIEGRTGSRLGRSDSDSGKS